MSALRQAQRQSQAIALRPVLPGECTAVVQLHRSVFSPSQVMRTIYGASGIDRYLASLIAYPQYQKNHQLWGAWDGETLAGYAHFRAFPDAWHLNNIAVLPAYQGLGIGRMLWQRFIDSAVDHRTRRSNRRGIRMVSLDVECNNTRAIAWYERQGLTASKKTWRYEKGLVISPFVSAAAAELPLRLADQPQVDLSGWEQAEAWQQAYGFSEFQLRYQGKEWPVGRLGKYYFRTRTPLPAELEMALIMIDARRGLLIISPEQLSSPDLKETGASLHMQGKLTFLNMGAKAGIPREKHQLQHQPPSNPLSLAEPQPGEQQR